MEVVEHSPGIDTEISIYNQEIAKQYPKSKLIDLNEQFDIEKERYLTADGHITKDAHRLIWDTLKTEIEQFRLQFKEHNQ